MAKVFLDANFYIDAVHRRPEVSKQFLDQEIYFSPLSTHILFYALKLKVPHLKIEKMSRKFKAIKLNWEILEKALAGPTSDLEDNIQLHSASDADCDYFLTNDKNILKMKFFGKARILSSLSK
jgi:predicted nucleic acid-binding protein